MLYLGNPEDLKDGVGDIFAHKVMQIPNLETDFESEQILCTAHAQKFEIFKKVEFFNDHEDLGIDNGTVMFRDRSSFIKANNFLNLTQLNIIDFLSSADLT